jgi:hypothetical protein
MAAIHQPGNKICALRVKYQNLGCAKRRNKFCPTAQTNIPWNDSEVKEILTKGKWVGGTKKLGSCRYG